MIDPVRLESAVETGFEFSWRILGEDLSRQLIDQGVVTEVMPQASMVCPDCCVPHPVRKTESGEYELACDAGRKIIDTDELRRWRINLPSFALWLSGMLGPPDKLNQRVMSVLWYLGDVHIGKGAVPIWFARRCDRLENVDAIKGSLERRAPAGPGILISSSPAAEAVSWPGKTQTLRLSDVLITARKEWGLCSKQLRSRAPAYCKQSGALGAPRKNDFENVVVFRQRMMNGQAQKKSLVAEANELLALQRKQFGVNECHSISTIKNAIRSEYGAWRDSGFRKPPDAT